MGSFSDPPFFRLASHDVKMLSASPLQLVAELVARSAAKLAAAAVAATAGMLAMRVMCKTSSKPVVTYWAGRGRCEPLRCLLAAGGAEFESRFLTCKADMRALLDTGKLAFEQVPLVEMDGLNLVQGQPTASYIARRFGLCPTDPAREYEARAVWASADDARTPMLKFPFHGDRELCQRELAGPKALLGRYAPRWEATLGRSGGPYLLGTAPSMADVAVWECLDFYRHIFGAAPFAEAFAPFPRLTAHYEATLKVGRLEEWRDVERPALFLPDWAVYAKTVRATLD